MSRVFLGGTINGSRWRDSFIQKLNIDYFNPVVKVWTEEAYLHELEEREKCDFCLYLITPKMRGYYSIAEVVDDSIKRPEKTLYCILLKDDGIEFTELQEKSLRAVGQLVVRNGAKWFKNIDDVIGFLNKNKR